MLIYAMSTLATTLTTHHCFEEKGGEEEEEEEVNECDAMCGLGPTVLPYARRYSADVLHQRSRYPNYACKEKQIRQNFGVVLCKRLIFQRASTWVHL